MADGATKGADRVWMAPGLSPVVSHTSHLDVSGRASPRSMSPRPASPLRRPVVTDSRDARAATAHAELEGLLRDDASSNSPASVLETDRAHSTHLAAVERQLREERAAKEMALTYVKSLEAIIEAYRGSDHSAGGASGSGGTAGVGGATVGRQSPSARRDDLPCAHQRQCRLRTESLQRRLQESMLREKVLSEKVESLKAQLSLADGPHAEAEWVRMLDHNRTLAVSVDSLKRKLKDEREKTAQLEERLKKAELALEEGRREWSVKENRYRRKYEGTPMHQRMVHDIAALEAENDSLSEMLDRAQSALTRSNEELASARAELDVLRRDAAVEALNNAIEAGEKERLALQGQVEDVTRQLCDMTREKKKAVDELVLRREQFRAEMDEVQRQHAREMERLQGDLRGVRQQLEQEKYVSARLSAEVQSQDFELSSTVESAAAERARGEAAHGALSTEMQRMRTELQLARKELAAAREELGRESVARKVAEARAESLSAQLARNQEKFRSLQDVTGLRAPSPLTVVVPVASKDASREGAVPQSPQVPLGHSASTGRIMNGSPRQKPAELVSSGSHRVLSLRGTSDATAHGDS